MINVWVFTFSLILVRVGAFVAAMPLFGGRNVPRMVKVGLSVALASMWFGSYGITPSVSLMLSAANIHWVSYLIAIGREVIFGAMLGFAFGLFLLPTRIAGAYIAQEMGLTLASISDPNAESSANVFAQFLESLGYLIFFSLDLHHVLLSVLHATFLKWPIGSPIDEYPVLPLINGMSEAHEWGLLLAAPLAICMFVTVIVLALMTKASPQLNLFSVGLTLRLGVGFVATLIFLPEMCLMMQRIFGHVSGFLSGLV